MISGGELFFGGRACPEGKYVKAQVVQAGDFNKDGLGDSVEIEGHCHDGYHSEPAALLHLSRPGSYHESLRPAEVEGSDLSYVEPPINWKWRMATSKNEPAFGKGDLVMTPLAEAGRIASFRIYFDEEFNVVQRTADILVEAGGHAERSEFSLEDLALMNPVSDLKPVAHAIAQATKEHFEGELRRLREILDIAELRHLKNKAKREVVGLQESLSSYVRWHLETFDSDMNSLAYDYLWEEVEKKLGVPLPKWLPEEIWVSGLD